jgi:hypothetical protein
MMKVAGAEEAADMTGAKAMIEVKGMTGVAVMMKEDKAGASLK